MEVVFPNDPVEAQFRVVGLALLHDRDRNNLRIGHVHAVGSVAEPHPVGRGFMVEIVDNAIKSQEQLVGRKVAFGHNSRGVAG